ncbi:MAG: PAS domain-containing sensor histidine kinase [Ferruginibacter sp.]
MQFFIQSSDRQSYRFEALFNHASLGILMVDSKGIIQSANPFALKLFGHSIEDLIDKPIELLIPPRYQHKHVDHRNAYALHPRSRPMGIGMDLFAVKKDGTEFPVEVSLGNYNENGEENVIAFICDISVRKQAEAAIEKLNDELETAVVKRTRELTIAMQELEDSKEVLSNSLEKEKELSELKSRFVSMASHEFRTPLSTVLSSAYLIEKYTTTDDQSKREKHLRRIISSVNMLTDILNDFLSVGKIEEGKILVRLTQFNIQELVIAMVEEMKNTLKKQQEIRYHHEGNPEVILDTSLMKHIIMNLVSNAGKFSPEASVIEIRTTNHNHQITLSVKDHGMGISNEDQEHLKERFFRGANAGNIQGTGLGLHIVSKYAELLNGTVACISELEKGTEFVIVFNTKTG